MSKIAKMLCLVLLVSAILFPSSAFAASSSDSKNKNSFFSGISSIFSFLTGSGGSQQNQSSSKFFSSKDWGDSWWNTGKGNDKGHDDKDKDRWDKDKHNSRKIWENYYCW